MVDTYISYFHRHTIVCIAVAITVVPLIFIGYRKAYRDPSFLLLAIHLLFKFLSELIMLEYAVQRFNNLIIYNISIPIRYALLSSMFFYKTENKTTRKYIVASIIGFTLFTVWDFVQANPSLSNLHNHHMVHYSTTIESILIIFWVLQYFYDAIRSLKITNLLTYPFFWICSGLLLFYASYVFIAPVLHYTEIWINPLDIGFLDTLPSIFEIVCMMLFTTGIYFFTSNIYAKQ